jgi:hypothetical protein
VKATRRSIWGKEEVSVAEDREMSSEEESEGTGPEEDATYFLDFGLRGEDVHEKTDDGDD